MSSSYVDVTSDQLFKNGYVKSCVDMMFFADTWSHSRMALAAKDNKLATSTGRTYYLDVNMEGDEVVIDKKSVFRTANDGRPFIRSNKKLALQMNWFVKNDDRHYKLKMGPNLIMSLYEDKVPDVVDLTDCVN